MILRAALIGLALSILATPSVAQPLFGNPFADAAAYRAERGELSEARYRVRYEVTRVERGGAPQISEITIDAASDWALVREGERLTLHDFRLNRVFTLAGDSFTTTNGLAFLTFRVMERQNRSYLQGALAAMGAVGEFPDACDAEAELGLVIPELPNTGVAALRERRGVFALRCNDRDMGGFTPGAGTAPPSAFWPTMYDEAPTHPTLHRRVRETGRAPAQMDISYREGTGGLSRRSWRLIAIETVSVPYPLDSSLHNRTADTLDNIVAQGAGRIASDAIAGRFEGGAPTLQDWDRRMAEIAARDGDAAAAMLLSPAFNMFPEINCDGGSSPNLCRLARGLRDFSDPAPWAVIEIAGAEGRGDTTTALSAMHRAQASPYRDHAALGAAFALAVLRFDDAMRQRAREANLPLNVREMQSRALMTFPYNPAYWTDISDTYAAQYDFFSAFTLMDIAFALPMPGAIEGNGALRGKRDLYTRIRRDFPDASLPATP